MILNCQAVGAAQQRHNGQTSHNAGQRLTASDIRAVNSGGSIMTKAKMQAAVGAGINAVHAHMAFGSAPFGRANWIVSTLAMLQATIAIVAAFQILLQPKDGPARGHAEQRPKRAYRPAPESGYAQIER